MGIFIGSSGKSRRVAKMLAELLEEEQTPPCQVWSEDVFELGGSTLPSLLRTGEEADYAVMIFGRDDVLVEGESETWVPRDNVVFESGLFSGLLGPERCFLVVATDTKLGSDFGGITVARFDPERFEEEPKAALRAAANAIVSVVLKGQPRPHAGVSRDYIDRFYAETGLTEAFPSRAEARTRILADIESAESSIAMYARVYFSELMRKQGSLVPALEKAATGGRGGSTLEVSQTTIDPEDDEMLSWSWKLEKTKNPPMYETLEDYREHVRKRIRYLAATHKNLETRLAKVRPSDRKRVRMVRRHLESPIPYSLLIIDRKIAWVSYYWRITLDPPHGPFAPTMRLVCSDGDSWARKLVDQAAEIDASNSYLGEELPII